MLYDYGAILNFDPSQMKKALDYFAKNSDSFIAEMSEIEEKYRTVQHTFDILHPNITFTIMGGKVDKDTLGVSFDNAISIVANGNQVHAEAHSAAGTAISRDSVVTIDSAGSAKDYLSGHFISRDTRNKRVSWMYNRSSLPVDISDYNVSDYVPFSVLSTEYYRKIGEEFHELHSLFVGAESEAVFTVAIGKRFFNEKQSQAIACNTKVVSGESVTIDDKSISFGLDVRISTNEMVADSTFQIRPLSPVALPYAKNTFATRTLGNAQSLSVREEPIGSRLDDEVVSQANIHTIVSWLYGVGTTEIDDNLKVEVSRETDAASFKSIFNSLTKFLNSFYGDRLKLFLEDYTDYGPLSDAIKYIEEQLRNIEGKYVSVDECAIPLKFGDSGCKISCDNIHLDEANLMVSKQKLKSVVICSLMCDTMPYTEEDLAAVPQQATSGGNSIVSPPNEIGE